MEPAKGRRGGFSPEISAVAVGFERSLGVVVARGEQEAPAGAPGPKILIPITGSETSRRGAEFAMAFAAGLGADCEALYAQAAARATVFPTCAAPSASVRRCSPICERWRNIMASASRERSTLASRRRMRSCAGGGGGGHTLIALGVSRRPGDALSFGQVADALLAQADCSRSSSSRVRRGARPEGSRLSPSSHRAHGRAGAGHVRLRLADRMDAEMEDRGRRAPRSPCRSSRPRRDGRASRRRRRR